MDIVTINWAKGAIDYETLKTSKQSYLKKTGFYAMLMGIYNPALGKYENTKLLYIGQAYKQTLGERILQPHNGYDCINNYIRKTPNAKLLTMVGVLAKTNISKVTQELFDDIECCLIYHNQPKCNEICKKSYSGRQLTIINTGDFSPLKPASDCKGS